MARLDTGTIVGFVSTLIQLEQGVSRVGMVEPNDVVEEFTESGEVNQGGTREEIEETI